MLPEDSPALLPNWNYPLTQETTNPFMNIAAYAVPAEKNAPLEQSLLKKEKIIWSARYFRIKLLKNMLQDMVAANAKRVFRVKVKFPCEIPTNIAIFNLATIPGQVFELFCKIKGHGDRFLVPI